MKHETYTVQLTVVTTKPLQEDDLFALAEGPGAVGGRVGNCLFTMTLSAEATSVLHAIEVGSTYVMKRVNGAVLGASAMLAEAFDKEQEERSKLAGVAEVAKMLGLSRQRVSVLSKRKDFPTPQQRLASGPLWRVGDLSTFQEGWQRKGGRPPKDVATVAASALTKAVDKRGGIKVRAVAASAMTQRRRAG